MELRLVEGHGLRRHLVEDRDHGLRRHGIHRRRHLVVVRLGRDLHRRLVVHRRRYLQSKEEVFRLRCQPK